MMIFSLILTMLWYRRIQLSIPNISNPNTLHTAEFFQSILLALMTGLAFFTFQPISKFALDPIVWMSYLAVGCVCVAFIFEFLKKDGSDYLQRATLILLSCIVITLFMPDQAKLIVIKPTQPIEAKK